MPQGLGVANVAKTFGTEQLTWWAETLGEFRYGEWWAETLGEFR